MIVITQATSGALGGSDYRDRFELPGTETNTVANLLNAQGSTNQTTTDGFVVLKATSATLTQPPPGRLARYERLCISGGRGISTPWGVIDCTTTRKLDPAFANPALISTKDPSIAITIVSFGSAVNLAPVTQVYDTLKPLRSDNLQVQFTGDIFEGQGAGKGINPSLPWL